MIGCLTETTTCVVAKPLVVIKEVATVKGVLAIKVLKIHPIEVKMMVNK